MKKLFHILIIYLSFTLSMNAQCWVSNLVTDIANGSDEFKALIKNSPEGTVQK